MSGGFIEFLQAVSEWPVAAMLRRHQTAYLILNAAHIMSIGLLVGAIMTLDLRILGLFRQYPMSALAPPLTRVAACAVVLAILTGAALFSVRPVAYVNNPAFLVKLGLIALGLGNALVLNLGRAWKLAVGKDRISSAVRFGAFISLVVWTSVVVAGRWIGFL